MGVIGTSGEALVCPGGLGLWAGVFGSTLVQTGRPLGHLEAKTLGKSLGSLTVLRSFSECPFFIIRPDAVGIMGLVMS